MLLPVPATPAPPVPLPLSFSSSFCTTSGTTLPSYVTGVVGDLIQVELCVDPRLGLVRAERAREHRVDVGRDLGVVRLLLGELRGGAERPACASRAGAGQSSCPRLSVTVTSLGSSPWTLEDTMWAMPATVDEASVPLSVRSTDARAADAWSWKSVSWGSTSCTCGTVTPSIPFDLRGDVALEAALERDPLLKVRRPEAEARHVGEARVVARGRRPWRPARPTPWTAGSRGRPPRCRRSRPCRSGRGEGLGDAVACRRDSGWSGRPCS